MATWSAPAPLALRGSGGAGALRPQCLGGGALRSQRLGGGALRSQRFRGPGKPVAATWSAHALPALRGPGKPVVATWSAPAPPALRGSGAVGALRSQRFGVGALRSQHLGPLESRWWRPGRRLRPLRLGAPQAWEPCGPGALGAEPCAPSA